MFELKCFFDKQIITWQVDLGDKYFDDFPVFCASEYNNLFTLIQGFYYNVGFKVGSWHFDQGIFYKIYYFSWIDISYRDNGLSGLNGISNVKLFDPFRDLVYILGCSSCDYPTLSRHWYKFYWCFSRWYCYWGRRIWASAAWAGSWRWWRRSIWRIPAGSIPAAAWSIIICQDHFKKLNDFSRITIFDDEDLFYDFFRFGDIKLSYKSFYSKEIFDGIDDGYFIGIFQGSYVAVLRQQRGDYAYQPWWAVEFQREEFFYNLWFIFISCKRIIRAKSWYITLPGLCDWL